VRGEPEFGRPAAAVSPRRLVLSLCQPRADGQAPETEKSPLGHECRLGAHHSEQRARVEHLIYSKHGAGFCNIAKKNPRAKFWSGFGD